MKKNIIILLSIILVTRIFSQAPNKLSYQSVVRNSSNLLVTNQLVGMQVSIIQGSTAGSTVYRETHKPRTNANGLVGFEIGGGSVILGSLSNIDWSKGPYFVQTEIDPSGGSNYTIFGVNQLLSVPYALYSATSGSSIPGPAGPQGPAGKDGAIGPQGPAGIGYSSGTAKNQIMYWSGSAWIPLNPGANTQSLTICNGELIWANGGQCSGRISALNCSGPANFGSLIAGEEAKNALTSISYNGGNGGEYSAQSINSTGVTGLTANLSAGNFAVGTGQLTFNISGTPSAKGVASFTLNVGGQSCTFTRIVEQPAGVISLLNCSSIVNIGNLTAGIASAGVNSVITYSGGNGGVYSSQSITSTGVVGLKASINSGTLANGSGTLTFYISGTPMNSGIAIFLINIGGQSCMILRAVDVGAGYISALNCSSEINSGSLMVDSAAVGVSSMVFYDGGNGGSFQAQVISSTGVTGLVASLQGGVLAKGSGSLEYKISGTPSKTGTANFTINIAGRSCILSRIVTSTSSKFPPGSKYCLDEPTIVVNVTNPVTGKIWMDRNLGAMQLANSSMDADAYGDLYQWGRFADGHQCRNSGTTSILSSTNQPTNSDFILTNNGYDWRTTQNDDLWQGLTGTNNPCPSGYRIPTLAEFSVERLSWSSDNSLGAFSSQLKLPMAGYRDHTIGMVSNTGSYGSYWSSTTNSSNASSIVFYSSGALVNNSYRSRGLSVRCIQDVYLLGSIEGMDCSAGINNVSLNSGIAASGINFSIPYYGGNGGVYFGKSTPSSVVTGLFATINSGTLATGSGTFLFTITGVPTSSGTAIFEIAVAGKICNLSLSVGPPRYPLGTVHCSGNSTAIVDVINPTTGKIWMDRNLGAIQAATSSWDVDSFGDLYQWGRFADGHQCRSSATISTVSTSDKPKHSSFIKGVFNNNYDWRDPQNSSLWKGISGVNNPCPSGYRIPSSAELNFERLSWNSNDIAGAFASSLRLPIAGNRNAIDGSINGAGSGGHYWSNTESNGSATGLNLNYGSLSTSYRASGFSVRCIKE